MKSWKCHHFLNAQSRLAIHYLIKVKNQKFHEIDHILRKCAP